MSDFSVDDGKWEYGDAAPISRAAFASMTKLALLQKRRYREPCEGDNNSPLNSSTSSGRMGDTPLASLSLTHVHYVKLPSSHVDASPFPIKN